MESQNTPLRPASDGQANSEQKPNRFSLTVTVAVIIVFTALVYRYQIRGVSVEKDYSRRNTSNTTEKKNINSGTTIPVQMGNLGAQMVAAGVIDREKFEQLYSGGLDEKEKLVIDGTANEQIIITEENAGFYLNMLWALGLSNKNPVLEQGPMNDSRYGGAKNFASTGGWTISRGNPMDHYSAHEFVRLTPKQQALVERTEKNIYRPCCGNSTYFPDCNHGMAMLGLLELMASQGASEEDMYRAALTLNKYWFPDTYATIGQYLSERGMDIDRADPKEILGSAYSSATGFARVQREITQPIQQPQGRSCGVSS